MAGIETMTIGAKPPGFTFARTGQGGDGEWTVTADPTAAGGRAIEQVSTERTDYRFPLAIHDSFSGANLNVEIRFKAVAGKVDQAHRQEQQHSRGDGEFHQRLGALLPAGGGVSSFRQFGQRHLSNRACILLALTWKKGISVANRAMNL